MSDASQGPGWWLASDGRWYPPESGVNPQPAAPVVPAPPPVTPTPPPRPPSAAPVPQQTFAPPPPTSSAPRPRPKAHTAGGSPLPILGAFVAAGGAFLLVIGALLPWLTFSSGHTTVPGIRGDGILTLVLGIGVVGLALGLVLMRHNRPAAIALAVTVMIVAVQMTTIAGINAIDIGRQFGGTGRGASTGVGLWLTLFATQICGLGGLIGLIGGITTKPSGGSPAANVAAH